MKFRTEITVERWDRQIDHGCRLLMCGSCFADNMASRLEHYRFRVVSNPFGVLYNPFSIADMLESLAAGRRFAAEDLDRDGELWFSYRHHGSFSGTDPQEVLRRIGRAADAGGRALREADTVVLTLGTAWVYELARDGGVVANCHKQPARLFRRRLLEVGEIEERLCELMTGCLAGKRVVLTVSPIRHMGDGAVENSVGKASLLVAVHRLAKRFADVLYFPAYEIMNDDLRDYRFYAPDMVHPSPQAVDYIWERFAGAAFSDGTRRLMAEIDAVAAAAAHRPQNPDSEAHRRFKASMRLRVERLAAELPEGDWSVERAAFAQ